MTAGCTYLPPLILSKRKKLDQDISITFLDHLGRFYSTDNGHMNNDSMMFWITDVLEPYVKKIRKSINNPGPKSITLMDGLPSHSTKNILSILTQIPNLVPLFLPPQSSHLTQPCDLFLFGVMKNLYNHHHPDPKLSAFSQNVFRIKKQ